MSWNGEFLDRGEDDVQDDRGVLLDQRRHGGRRNSSMPWHHGCLSFADLNMEQG